MNYEFLRARFDSAVEDDVASDARARFYLDGLGVAADVNARGESPYPCFQVNLFMAGTRNGFEYSVDVLRSAAPLWQGVASFVDHSRAQGDRYEYPSLRNLAGVIRRAWFDEFESSVVGVLELVPGANQVWLVELLSYLVRERAAGRVVPNVGTSADMLFEKKGSVVSRIARILSHDVVFGPAAGGYFQRALFDAAASDAQGAGNFPRGGLMFQRFFRLQFDADGGGNGGGAVQSQILQTPPPPALQLQTASVPAVDLIEQSRGILRAQCAALLEAALGNASDLPESFRTMVRERYAEQIFSPQELSGAIQQARTLYASTVEPRVVQGMGENSQRPRSAVTLWSDLDRLQFAFNRLMGLPIPEEHQGLPRLSGVRELYLMVTGDRAFHGIFDAERAQFANATTTTMAALVTDAMNKVIPARWELLGREGYSWYEKVAHQADFESLQDVKWLTVGGFGDFPTVLEGAAYTELTWDDNKETSAFLKKGGYIGVTLEMMAKDETNKVKQIPIGIATGGIRTLSALVAALFTQAAALGPTLADGATLFHSTSALRGGDGVTAASGNLSTVALSASEWDVHVQKTYAKTELNSAKRLALRPRYVLVPIELEKTALQIFISPTEPSSNVFYQNVRRTEVNNVIPVPEWTDATDWASVVDPEIYPCIGIGYFQGNRRPEVFVADDSVVGSMFTNDELRVKGRFFMAVGIIDWRGLRKANVA